MALSNGRHFIAWRSPMGATLLHLELWLVVAIQGLKHCNKSAEPWTAQVFMAGQGSLKGIKKMGVLCLRTMHKKASVIERERERERERELQMRLLAMQEEEFTTGAPWVRWKHVPRPIFAVPMACEHSPCLPWIVLSPTCSNLDHVRGATNVRATQPSAISCC